MGVVKYILVIVWSIGFVNAQEYDTIIWQKNTKLTWEDFKGKPPLSDRVAATTASGITYRYSAIQMGDKMQVDFKVTTFFYPQKSWYKPSVCDSVILGHEQLHFDISELYARKLKKRLNAKEYSKNVKAEVRKIYNEVVEELNVFQNKYDEETNFSRDREKQSLWKVKIEKALK
ncbi:DUF922 domain-containing protein [uncultured Maribacter sp.]|uniref:DUF922 domain-containing protein n=1 Tax=uncultured Maribacter sp. TaxID=431308 RepID=UPI00260F3A6C|nr:DUF922 domain-containing protein [uncultured Maribacter sp.]